MSETPGKRRSVLALEWLNFFLADVQTGLGPFLAAYLASSGWNPGSVGYVLTFGGLVGVAMQTPAGAVIDAVHRKRTLLAVNLGLLVAGALLGAGTATWWASLYRNLVLADRPEAAASLLSGRSSGDAKSAPLALVVCLSTLLIAAMIALPWLKFY